MLFFKGFFTSIFAIGLLAFKTSPAQAAGCGEASFYGVNDGFHGRLTASGQRFNTYSLTAAHPYYPLGSRVRVSKGNRSVVVTINDRGPYGYGRLIDLSYAAFSRLANPGSGVTRVCLARI